MMLGTLRRFFTKIGLVSPPTHSPEGFPLRPEPFWYTGAWYSHRYDEQQAGRPWRTDHAPWPVEGKIMFNYNWCGEHVGGASDRGLVDDLIPAMRLGDLVGLYKVTDRRRCVGMDRAGWDDGMEVQLEFVRAVPASDVPRLRGIPHDAEIDWEHVEIWSYHDPEGRRGDALVEKDLFNCHWIDVTVVVVGMGPACPRMPWGRAEVPRVVTEVPEDHLAQGHPMRENYDGAPRPTLKKVPEDQDPHEYAKEVGGIVAHGTYVPEGFHRAAGPTCRRSA